MMKSTKRVSFFIWTLNKAIKNFRKSFIIESFYGLEQILNILYIDGWVSGYKKYADKKCFEIFLKNDINNKIIVNRAINVTKPTLQAVIHLAELCADSKNTAYTGVIRTAKYGFLQNRQAFIKKSGGIYLVKLF